MHDNITDIYTHMKLFSRELRERILEDYPALQRFEDPISPRIRQLLGRPFPAQAIALMGVAKRWQQHRMAGIAAECGTNKTWMSLGAIHLHSAGRPYTAIAMVPPHLVEKWAREAILSLRGIRVFTVDDLRNGGDPKIPHGVNEVRLRGKRIVRKGLHTKLTDLQLRKPCRTAALIVGSRSVLAPACLLWAAREPSWAITGDTHFIFRAARRIMPVQSIPKNRGSSHRQR